MGLEVYYPIDIENAIRAAEQATAAARNDTSNDRYLEGYRAALTTIALAFGLTDDNRPGLPSLTGNNGRILALTHGQ